jgi:hypothetical protein
MFHTASFNTSGTTLIDSLSLSGSPKAQNGVLVLHLQGAPDEPELVGDRPSVSEMNGNIEAVTVEQSGPVRAVIKMTGQYTGAGHADFLPFILRFYIVAGATTLKMSHFFMYDGDQTTDFIKGLVSSSLLSCDFRAHGKAGVPILYAAFGPCT